MSNVEFRAILAILETADGHCSHCALKLAEEMEKKFPGWPWVNEMRKLVGLET